jgi:hypothetical protein
MEQVFIDEKSFLWDWLGGLRRADIDPYAQFETM